MGLIDKIKDNTKKLALAGALGSSLYLSGCVVHGGPREMSNFVFRDVMGFPGMKDKDKENQNQGYNQNNSSQGEVNRQNNNAVQILPNRKSFCDTVVIFDENSLSASGVKKYFRENEPIVFTAMIQCDKSGEVKLNILEKTNGKKIYEKYSGIRATGSNTVFFQRENAKMFAQYGSSFDYCWKVGDEIVANSYFNIERE